MSKVNVIVVGIAAALGLTLSVRGEDTNAWPGLSMTRLEAAQTNTDRVIIKGTSPIGQIVANGGTLGVSCKEVTDAATGQKDYGIAISMTEGQEGAAAALIDYDELVPLLNGLDYIGKVDWSVTSLNGFDVFYTTKDGFRILAFSRGRTGTIEMAVRNLRTTQRPLLLTRDRVAQLRNLVEQAKNKLDELRAAR